MGLSLSGPALLLAKQSTRHAGVRYSAREVRPLFAEPRSSGQFAARRAAPRADEPRPTSGDDRALALDAPDAAVVPRAGVRCVVAVPLLQRLPRRSVRGRRA